ncbi:MAG: enoyl-CoA hydratase-related protein [Phycisphaerae bacterium]
MTSFSTIWTDSAEGVLTITLNRPDALNALNGPMSVELGTALRLAQRNDAVRCIVLTGAGRAFCAGQDLKELAAARDGKLDDEGLELGAILRQRYNPLIVRLRTMEMPVIAAINGVAAGGGASLALAADLRLCARSAKLIMAFVNIGLVPDMASTQTLVQQAGYARAAEMCMLGEPVSAEDALSWGLVNRVVDDEELAAAAQEFARRLAAKPTQAIGLAKRALNHAWTATLDEQLEYEAFQQATAAKSTDHAEGVAAFLARRPPRFTGK